MREAYQMALSDGQAEFAETLWRTLNPRARLPRALRKLIASPNTPPVNVAPTLELAIQAPPRSMIERRLTRTENGTRTLATLREKAWQHHQGVLEAAKLLLPYYPTETSLEAPLAYRAELSRERLRRRLTRALGWAQFVTIIVVIVAVVAFWFQEQSVNTMIQTLPQQMTTQAQVYTDPLTYQDYDWCLHTPTKDDAAYYEFANGSYELGDTDPKYSAVCGSNKELTDSAMSVRVSITSASAKADTRALMAGILFDEQGDYHSYAMFGVDMQGDWALYRYNGAADSNDQWTWADNGTSAAIHTGAGAVNTLLLVRHGPLYLAYVNGMLVDRYYDRASNGSIIGSVNVPPEFSPGGNYGVYIDGGNIVGHFRDFAIYSLPPALAQIPLSQNLPFWFA
jgi:hypothetical protein